MFARHPGAKMYFLQQISFVPSSTQKGFRNVYQNILNKQGRKHHLTSASPGNGRTILIPNIVLLSDL